MSAAEGFRYFTGEGGEWGVFDAYAESALAIVREHYGPQTEITREEYRRLRRNRLARERRAER